MTREPVVLRSLRMMLAAAALTVAVAVGGQSFPSRPVTLTVAESGYPGFEATNWYAFVAPGKTPKDLLDFWNRELTKVLNDPQVRAELAKHGLRLALLGQVARLRNPRLESTASVKT